jgi:RNA polymerase sigma-70 factor, ECF subfamily
MNMDATLEELMVRYQAGDFAAARVLIERISPQLHRFFDAQAANRTDTDDLLQDAWLRIHLARRSYLSGRPLLPWIYAIARRVRVDHYRIAVRTRGREQRWDEVAEETWVVRADAHCGDELEELLAPLSDAQREVLAMIKVAGMSLEEVARATSCSVGSVKQKVHRAYEKLRQSMSLAQLSKGETGVAP